MRIKAVLFDKDGVLVDFQRTWGPASAQVMRSLAEGDETRARALAEAVAFDMDTHSYRPESPFIAGSSLDTLMAWDPLLGVMKKPELCREIVRLFSANGLDCVAAAPALSETLTALNDAGLPLGIATNDQEDSARRQMDKLGMVPHFHTIFGADSGHGAKPKPGMLLAFADLVQIEPSRLAMVGDSLHDVHAARAAGAIAIAIGTGPADLESLRPHADHAIADLSELSPLIAAVNRGEAV